MREDGRTAMKPTMPLLHNQSPSTAPKGAGGERDDWRRWVGALRRYRLDGLMGWFIDTGRPLALISAQFMYAAGPFLGSGIERLGHMLESDEDSRAFAQMLQGGPRAAGFGDEEQDT